MAVRRLLRCCWSLAIAGATCHASAATDTVVIYSATDRQIIAPLIADFERTHTDIRVEYHDMNSTDLYQRFLAEIGTGSKADVVWSSAMDLQMKLVNDGHARSYRSAETQALPAWAVWKDEAFGTTYEPVGFAYNKKLLAPDEVPQTHAELVRLLADRPERFHERLTTYDPHRSGLGYLLHTQDLEANPVVFWDLVQAMGRAGLGAEPTTTAMLDRLAGGQALLGYNVLTSYARARAAADPRIGVVLPRDYTLVISRIAFISRHAPHPETARIWLDYLLSSRGQAMLDQVGLLSVRTDLAGHSAAAELRRQLGKAFRPVALSTGLLTYLDQLKRERFLGHWDARLNGRSEATNR